MTREDREHVVAEAIRLRRADAGNVEQLADGARPAGGKSDERLVVEHDIGRDIRGASTAAAPESSSYSATPERGA